MGKRNRRARGRYEGAVDFLSTSVFVVCLLRALWGMFHVLSVFVGDLLPCGSRWLSTLACSGCRRESYSRERDRGGMHETGDSVSGHRVNPGTTRRTRFCVHTLL